MVFPLRALFALAILGFMPGAILYRAIRPGGSRLLGAALAPTLSFAFVFLFGEVASIVGVPFAPGTYLVATAATALVAVARSYQRGRARKAPRGAVLRADLLLLAGIVLGLGSWILGIQGFATTPPHSDSANHGLMAAQVSDRESLDPGEVLSSDVAGDFSERVETAYYPLALHGQVALAHRLFGVGYADGLLAATVLFSAVVLPLGLFVAVRHAVPGNPLLAGLTALLGGTTGFFPLQPLSFGGLPLIIGMAMVPAVALITVRYLTGDGRPSDAVLAAVGAVGILATHTSEIPLLLMFVTPVAVASLLAGGSTLAVLVRRAVILGGLAVLLAAPTLALVAHGADERSGIDEGRFASVTETLSTLRAVVGGGTGDLLGLLATAGLAVCLYRRRHLPLIATTAGMLALVLIASGVRGPLRAFTVPWYQHPGRLALNFVLVIPFFAALALVELVRTLWSRRRAVGSPLMPVLALAANLALAGSAGAAADTRTLFRERAHVGSEARAAFAFLQAHVAPGERVLNDMNTDGALWMYPFAGVLPLLGLQPAKPGPSWDERVWLVEHLADLGQDEKVRAVLDHYRVRFVYFDERSFVGNPRHLDIPALQGHPLLCERFQRGTVHVLEVVRDAADCLPVTSADSGA